MDAKRAICSVLLIGLVWPGVSGAQDGAARRRFAQAAELASRGEATASVDVYKDLVRQYPEDDLVPLALLRVAEGRWAMGDAAGARAVTAQLRELHPAAPATAGAYVLEGQMQLAMAITLNDLRDVWVTLGHVRSAFDPLVYPDPAWRRHAGLLRGRVAVLLDELDLAAAELLTVLEEDSVAHGRSHILEARVELAQVFLAQGQFREGAEILQRVIEDGDTTPAPSNTTRRTVDLARRRLSLLQRIVFRPLAGQSAWTSVRSLVVPGGGLRAPNGVAVSDDGHLVVADERADLALVFDPGGALIATSVVENPRLPWWGTDGQAYVLDRRLVKRPLSEPDPVTFAMPEGVELRPMNDLRAGAQGPLGEWVLLDVDLRRVVRFDRYRRYQSTVVFRRLAEEITDVAVDLRGRIWLLDRDEDRVLRAGLDGNPDTVFATGEWRRPEAVAVDALGGAYVLDRDAKTVSVFGPDGALKLLVGPVLPDGTELRSPRDVAVDGAGRLYLADRGRNAVFILE